MLSCSIFLFAIRLEKCSSSNSGWLLSFSIQTWVIIHSHSRWYLWRGTPIISPSNTRCFYWMRKFLAWLQFLKCHGHCNWTGVQCNKRDSHQSVRMDLMCARREWHVTWSRRFVLASTTLKLEVMWWPEFLLPTTPWAEWRHPSMWHGPGLTGIHPVSREGCQATKISNVQFY